MTKFFARSCSVTVVGLSLLSAAPAQEQPAFPSITAAKPRSTQGGSARIVCPGFRAAEGGAGTSSLGIKDLKPAGQDVQAQVLRLIGRIGVKHPIIVYISEDAEVRRALAKAAVIPKEGKEDEWAIIYSEQELKLLHSKVRNSWAILFVLAHEAGHHFNQATMIQTNVELVGSTPDREKEADYFGGFILKCLGANLKDAQIAIATGESDDGPPSKTHPPKTIRLSEIEEGWKKAPAPHAVFRGPEKPAQEKPAQEKPAQEKPPSNEGDKDPGRRVIPSANVPDRMQVFCMHRVPCSHQVPCTHFGPCTHPPVACAHPQLVNVLCGHTMPCTHVLRNGFAAHPWDTMHQFDVVQVPLPLHPQGDVPHPLGCKPHFFDLLHYLEGDAHHLEGHLIERESLPSAADPGFRASGGLPAPINLSSLPIDP
jgi:hypothetical protein